MICDECSHNVHKAAKLQQMIKQYNCSRSTSRQRGSIER